MSETRSVRACPICSEKNPAYADTCRICGEDVGGVRPSILHSAGKGPSLGAPERAVVGAGLAVILAAILLPNQGPGSIPISFLLRWVRSSDDELAHLPDLFHHPSICLLMICGIIGAVLAALTALANGWHLRDFALAPTRRKPCPCCAELIQSEASVCRYCGHALMPNRTTPMIDGAPALR